MDWNKEQVGAVLLTARLEQGLSLGELSAIAGVKTSTVSSIERGLHCRPPHEDTQRKLEEALGIKLPIPRGGPKTVCIYVTAQQKHIIEETVTKFPEQNQGQAIMSALIEWSIHRKALDKWNRDHPEKL